MTDTVLESRDPMTGEVIANYLVPDDAAVDAAIERCARAQEGWRRTPFADRTAVVRQAAELLERRRDELAGLMADEMGKPVRDGRGEVDKCAWVCRYYAQHAAEMLADRPIVTERRSYVHHEPLGPVLAVMPWNFPLWQVFRFAAPALMAGNGGLLKHASNVSGAALAIEAVFADAGAPGGLFTTLLIPSSRVAAVIANPRVRAVTLTGSGPAGAAVAAAAGAHLKKAVLELGGSDPYVVLADADVEHAADTCATSRLINSGQSCIAAKRFIVDRSIHDDFVDAVRAAMAKRVMAHPHDEDTDVGPQARHDLRDEVHVQVRASIDAGATCVLGGEVPDGPAAFYPPSLLVDVAPGMPAYDDEIFGPVGSVIAADGEDDAIRIANDTAFGLGAAVFTRDAERGERIAATRLEAGACFVNAFVASDPRLPFGGIKDSGIGRELSDLGILEFVNAKTVVVA